MDIFIFYILLNAVLAAPVAYVASQKGRSPLGFYALSFFFSFLVGILVILALPKQTIRSSANSYTGKVTQTADGEELVKCPFCAEWVKSEAIRCRYCGEDIGKALEEIKATEHKAKADVAAAAKIEREAAAQYAEENKDKRRKAVLLTSVGVGVGLVVVIAATVFISSEQKKAEAAKALEIAQAACPVFRDAAREVDTFISGAIFDAYMGQWSSGRTNLEHVNALTAKIYDEAAGLPGVWHGDDSYNGAVAQLQSRLSGYIGARASGEDPFITSYRANVSDAKNAVLDYCAAQTEGATPAP